MSKHRKHGEGFVLSITESLEEFLSRGITDRMIGIETLEARVAAGHVNMFPTKKDNEFYLLWDKISH